MRILHVISSLGLGGAESIAVDLASRHPDGSECLVFTIFPVNKSEESTGNLRRDTLRSSNISLSEGRFYGRASLMTSIPRLLTHINEFKPDIVHSHTDLPDLLVSLCRRLSKFSVARTIHNTSLWEKHRDVGRFVEHKFDNDLVVCINEPCKLAYLDLRRLSNKPESNYLKIISNGVPRLNDSDYLDRVRGLDILGGDPDKIHIGFIGRLEEQKGIDIALDAFSKLNCRERSSVQFHIIGDGSLRPIVAESYLYGDVVKLHGSLADAKTFLRVFDYLLIPSRFEGMPLVGIEARFAGIPAIISNAAGLVNVFPEDWNWVFDLDNKDSLVEILSRAISTGRGNIFKPSDDLMRQYSVESMATSYWLAYAEYLDQLNSH